ncbi:S8 family serine peptidase [Algoriphagus sediminis]|uniref:S8 family serine peptidase n=1 Tax=Algoriphagus sediminis TaxID=3057113 RepID=A0ABT7YAP4_9BACT|nr:S8 family serine peptidase [Algoriphagus sediminis]MDN3203592.1 S8 family serine peptidase [Algoriphagus sediminis]
MDVSKKFGWLMVILLWAFSAKAQDRYAVFYKYKPQEEFSLSNPSQYLTQKALDRRSKEGVQIDSLDLPVSNKYISEVEILSEYIIFNSKWFNASVAVLSESAVKEVSELPFVEKVEYVAPGFRVNPNARIREKVLASVTRETCLSENKRILDEGEKPYYFQNELLGIPEMHDEGFRGEGITIAVMDAGFPAVNSQSIFSQLFDNNQLVATRDFVRPWMADVFFDNQHGTNVLSLIASNDPETLQAGAPDANYVLIITEDDDTEYRIEEYTWVRGAEYADSLGVDIIHSSVGYYDFDDPSMNYSSEDMDGKTAVITQGAQIASRKGILVVNSSGNYGSGESTLVAPADAPDVLTIGGTTSDLVVAGFSSRGPTADGRMKPDLATFASGVALLRSNGSLGFANGTSFSAPQVTALAAGLMQARPDWSREELVENLKRSGTQSDNPDNLLGFGIPNFYRAYYGEILDVVEQEEIVWKIYPNPAKGDVLSIMVGNELSTEVILTDMNGRQIIQTELNRNRVTEPYILRLNEVSSGIYILQAMDGIQPRRTKLIRN